MATPRNFPCASYLDERTLKYEPIVDEKLSYFFTCVDIANQLLTRHSPPAPLVQVDE